MPNVRCRYHTDDGEPKQGGCRKRYTAGGCPFVHPDSSAWATAALASSKPGSSKGGGGRSAGGLGNAQGTTKGGGKSGSGSFSGMREPLWGAAASPGWGNPEGSGGWEDRKSVV